MSTIGEPGDPQRPRALFARVDVVLLRPKSPGNVGSVARAMMNMGFSRLHVAEPCPVDDPEWFRTEAHRLAWNASDLLDRREVHDTLQQALAPFTLILGTSSRPRPGALVSTPREAAAQIAEHLRSRPEGRAAMLLGQEDNGLTHEDQAHCHRIGCIPAASEYVSLNLAQAALLFLYELRLAFMEPDAVRPVDGDRPGAPDSARMEGFFERMEAALSAIDFFEGTSGPHMMRELKGLFNRAILDERELAILEGILHRVHWTATHGR